MSEVTVIVHQGHTIVKTAFRRASDLGGLKAVLAQTGMAYTKLITGKILSLVVFHDQEFDETTINLFEAVAKANAHVVKATAFLGVAGPQRALFNAMISITGRKAKLFDDETSALDYLASADDEEDLLAGL
jgi:hypothetical protein